MNLNYCRIVYSTRRVLINIKKYIQICFILVVCCIQYQEQQQLQLLLEIIIMMIIIMMMMMMMMTKEKSGRQYIYIYILSICIFLKQNVYAIDDETAIAERN
jgi:hypothetical protein